MAANALLSSGSSGGIRLTQMKSGAAMPSACSGGSGTRSMVSGWIADLYSSLSEPLADLGIAGLLLHQLPVNRVIQKGAENNPES